MEVDSKNIIATYHDESSGKDFVIYTDMTYNRNNRLNAYYGYYEDKDGKILVTDINDKEDEAIILEILKQIIK